jgi:hypothetical protein
MGVPLIVYPILILVTMGSFVYVLTNALKKGLFAFVFFALLTAGLAIYEKCTSLFH